MLSRKRLDYLILTVIYTLCTCAIILIFIELHDRDTASFARRAQIKVERLFASTIKVFDKYSEFVFRDIIVTPEVKKLIEKCNLFPGRNGAVIKVCRILSARVRRLIKRIYCGIELYSSTGRKIMVRYRNSLPASLSLLPGQSIMRAIRKKKHLVGFEWGVDGCGFRFIYPIVHGKRYLGTIVLSIPSEAVLKILSENSGYSVRFVMLRRPHHSRMIAKSGGSGLFIRIRPGFIMRKTTASLIPGITDSVFFASREAALQRGFTSGQFFLLQYSLKKKRWSVAALPFKTISGRRAGYLLVAGSGLALISRSRMYLLVAGLIIFIMTTITLFAFYVIRTKVFFRYSSTYDALTGAFTRISFTDFFEREAEKTKRYGRIFSLILFDIDHFADVNGRAGREAGDNVLRHLGDMVRGTIRKCDYFVRWGGEEFLILLPETELSGAMVAAEKLRLHLKNFDFSIGIPVTASFGVCRFKHKSGDVNDAVNRAVERLYEAKKKGGDRISVCDPLGV